MASYNKIFLLGNIGQVDVKTFQNGGKVVECSLATTERYTDRNNQQQEETWWHKLIIGGKLADFAEKYVIKGSPLFVTGKMTYRKYTTQAGETKSVPEVRVDSIQLLPTGQKEGAARNSVKATGAPVEAAPAPGENPHLAELQAPEGGEGGDDLPF